MDSPLNSNPLLTGKVISIFAVLLILSSGIGAIVGHNLFPQGNTPTSLQNEALPVAIAQSSPTGGIIIGSPDENRIIFGTVTAIKGNSFTLHTQISKITNPTLIDRTVMVTNDTKIIKIGQKDSKELQNEMNIYATKMNDAKSRPQLLLSPNPFSRVPVDASEISIGDIVSIKAVGNINEKSFTASEIDFHGPIPKTAPISK